MNRSPPRSNATVVALAVSRGNVMIEYPVVNLSYWKPNVA